MNIGTQNLPGEFAVYNNGTWNSYMNQFIPKVFVSAMFLLTASDLAVKCEGVPLPRERPPVLEDQTAAPTVAP